MKRIMILLLLVTATILAAELTVEIPFDQNIILPDYSGSGDDHFTSEWITVTNTSAEAQDYKIEFQIDNVPEGWMLGVCNEQTCYMANFSVPFNLDAGESRLIHITLDYNSNGSFTFPIIFSEGDLTEALVYDFTFTVGESSADEDLIVNDVISNYPNPFNPETTFRFNTTNSIENGKVMIFNSRGQQIQELKVNSSTAVWKADNQPSGVYFYKLVSDNVNSKMKKMTLMK